NLHHLAMLRQAQRQYAESAVVCRALLRQRLKGTGSLDKQTRLVLASALLEMNDLRGVHEAMIGLYRQRLTLGEGLQLLHVESEYLARIGAWDQLVHNLDGKIAMAEIMPAAPS